MNIKPLIIPVFLLLFFLIFYSPVLTKSEELVHQDIRWSKNLTSSKSEFRNIQKVLILTESEMTIANQFCEDVLAVELMMSKISVVSRELRDREQYQSIY